MVGTMNTLMMTGILFSLAFPSNHYLLAQNNDITPLYDSDVNESKIKISSTKAEEPAKDLFIENFDVSSLGKIAINLEGKAINLYDAEGSYLYTIYYQANALGDSVVFWDNDMLTIYSVRGNICSVINEEGMVVKNYEYTGDTSNLINSQKKKSSFSQAGRNYVLSRNSFLLKFTDYYDSCSILTEKSETVVYSYNPQLYSKKIIAQCIKDIAFAVLVIVIVVAGRHYKHSKSPL